MGNGKVRKMSFIGSPNLRQPSKEITEMNEDIKQLMLDMDATVKSYGGIGLAAPQVGENIRLIAIYVDPANDSKKSYPFYMINPEIIESDATQTATEACLSIPAAQADVERPGYIRVKFLDADMVPQEMSMTGVAAVVVSHEVDHINGVLFVDRLSPLKRDLYTKKAKKFLKMSGLASF